MNSGLCSLSSLRSIVDEDVDRVGRRALRVAQQPAFRGADRRVVRAVHLRAAVDQIEHNFLLYHLKTDALPAAARHETAFFCCGCCALCVLLVQRVQRHDAVPAVPSTRKRSICRSTASATVYVNSSLAALNALRGTTFDASPAARVDTAAVRAYYSTPGHPRRPRQPVAPQQPAVRPRPPRRRRHHASWASARRSRGRRTSSRATAICSSTGRPSARPAGKDVGNVGWNGSEIVAFRLHLPSKIRYHNTKRDVGRGNILVWEQSLADRLRSVPLELDARMERAVDSLHDALAVRHDLRRRGPRVRGRGRVDRAQRRPRETARPTHLTRATCPTHLT